MAEDFMAMYKQALERLSTGGQSLEASLQEIEEGKKQAIAGGQQALVSGGMGGTTVMGGVPIQAEKIASRQRLGARGRAEEKYLTTLASFAAFAQQGEEAAKRRAFEAQQSRLGRQSQEIMQIRGMQTPSQPGYDVFGQPMVGSMAQTQADYMKWQMSQPSGGGQAEQFPSLYGQETSVPDWMGAGAGAGAGVGAGAGAGGGGYYAEQPSGQADVSVMPGGEMGSLAAASQMGGQPTGAGSGTKQYSQYKGRGGTASYSDWLKSGKSTGAPGKYYVGEGYAYSPQEYA